MSNSNENVSRSFADLRAGLVKQMVEYADTLFDIEVGLVRLKPRKQYHHNRFDMKASEDQGCLHPLSTSLEYALLTLERGTPEDIKRAEGIIIQVLSHQETVNADHPERVGLWHYYAEGKVSEWSTPDFNTADFNGLTLLLIEFLHGNTLKPSTHKAITSCLARATACIIRRNVPPSYTNIAALGAFVISGTAELLQDDVYCSEARIRLQRLLEETTEKGTDSFSEYASANYLPVALTALTSIIQFVSDPLCTDRARKIAQRVWRHLARHYHPETGELAGPHSRAYSIRLKDAPHRLGTILANASEGRLFYDFSVSGHDSEFGALHGCFLKFHIPDSLCDAFFTPNKHRFERETAEYRKGKYPVRTATYVTPHFCIGSVNLQEGWEQRQNLIGYWATQNHGVGYLRYRYLHDQNSCCSGFFASSQDNGIVLASSFLGKYADLFFTEPVEGISAEFLGAELEINNDTEPLEVYGEGGPLPTGAKLSCSEGDVFWIKTPQVWIALRLIRHRSRPFAETECTLSVSESGALFRLAHYDGFRRWIHWNEFQTAHSIFAVEMQRPDDDWQSWQRKTSDSAAHVLEIDNRISVTLQNLALDFPDELLPRENIRVICSDSSGHFEAIPSQAL